ncbi:MAG: hypothetical protein GY851_05270 [bacterium]|nr:hypothetical protein [bacterium]
MRAGRPLDITGEKARLALRPTRVWHPLLFALCPVVGLFANNAGKIPVDALQRPAGVFLGFAFLLWLVLRVVVRDRYRAGLFTSLIVFTFFVLWGVLEDLIYRVVPLLSGWPPVVFYVGYGVLGTAGVGAIAWRHRRRPTFLAALTVGLGVAALAWLAIATFLLSPVFGRRAAWLITGYLFVFVGGVVVVLRFRGDLQVATRSANAFAGVLVLLYLAVLGFNAPWGLAPVVPPLDIQAARAPGPDDPDIVVIALDGYGRSDVLSDVYGYNNLTFEQAMKREGFIIAGGSTSNYAEAELSLISLLNMDSVGALLSGAADGGGIEPRLGTLLHDNRTFRFLKERGYTLMSFSAGLEVFEPRPPVDERLCPDRSLREVEAVLLGRTVASRVMQVVYYLKYRNPAYWRFELRRKRVEYALEEMSRLVGESHDTPRLIVANLLIPEPPFLFTRTGERAEPFGEGSLAIDLMFRGTQSEYRQAYIEQLHYVNTRMVRSAASIINEASRPTVVLVVSATGANSLRVAAAATGPRPERYANLIAVRMPPELKALEGAGPSDFYDSMSLLNVMRVTFNRIFGTKLPLLSDERFVVQEFRPYSETLLGAARAAD